MTSEIPELDEDDRFDRLEAETRRLNTSIEGLTQALVDTSQVQAKIAGLDERQKVIEDVLVPRDELDARVEQARAEQATYRRKAVRRTTVLGLFIVAFLTAATIIGVIVGNAFSRDQKQFANLQYNMCVSNNKGVQTLREYITAQRKAEVLNPVDSPAIKTLKLSNFDALLKKYPEPTQDCNKIPGAPKS